MLLPRIIPCLLIHNGGLVKTTKFSSPKYIGDPLNAVKIFNEKEVDELIVIDIDNTVMNKEPNYKLITNLARECRMPICYGGGVNSVQQIERIVGLGIEKVSISSAFFKNPELIYEASKRVGSQSIVVVLDIRKEGVIKKKYTIFTHNGTKKQPFEIDNVILKIQELGAGEIVINSIDRDGTLTGYDYELIELIKPKVNIPITILGGASSAEDISNVISRFGIIGSAAGSLFVFKGKFKAVLLQYPSKAEKQIIFSKFNIN